MKIMAENEYFNIGSIVACTTCYQQKIQGEVLAFDLGTKMLAIKSPATNGKQNANDVRLVNLAYVSDVKVVKEVDKEVSPPPLPSLSLHKIAKRCRENVDEKKRQVNYIGVGVTAEGQRVFNAIVKTISDIRWVGQNILVMEEVTIKPPYGLENCYGKEGNKALGHVKKIVDKHLKEQELQRSSGDVHKSLSPSPSPTSS